MRKQPRLLELLALGNFESIEEARRRARASLGVARRSRMFDLQDLKAWEVCIRGGACGLPCCSITMRRWRRRLLKEVVAGFARARKADAGQKRYWAFSIVSDTWTFPAGKLDTCRISKIKRDLHEILRRAGYSHLRVFGGLDFSYNEHAKALFPPHWSVHAYCILEAPRELTGTFIEGAIAAQIKPSRITPRPVKHRRISDPIAAVLYSFKSIFVRRISYTAANGRRSTRDLPLRPHQEAELLAFLARQKRRARLFINRFEWRSWVLMPCEAKD